MKNKSTQAIEGKVIVEKTAANKALTREQIKKTVYKEAERLTVETNANDKKNLVLKITEHEIKKCLVFDTEISDYVPQFNMQWYSFVETFINYKIIQANTFKLDIDESVNPKLKKIFLEAWQIYFADEIAKVLSDTKRVKRKIRLFSIFGSVIIFSIIGAYLIYYFFTNSSETLHKTALALTVILGNGIYVFGWGMYWDVFTAEVGTLRDFKKRLESLYLMHEAGKELNN